MIGYGRCCCFLTPQKNTGDKNTAARRLLRLLNVSFVFLLSSGQPVCIQSTNTANLAHGGSPKTKLAIFQGRPALFGNGTCLCACLLWGRCAWMSHCKHENSINEDPSVCPVYNNSRHLTDALPRVTCNKCSSEHSSSSTRFVLDNPPTEHTHGFSQYHTSNLQCGPSPTLTWIRAPTL